MYLKLTPARTGPSSSLAAFSSPYIMHTHHIDFPLGLLYQSYKSSVSTEHTSLRPSYLVFHKNSFSKLHQVSARTDSFKRKFSLYFTQASWQSSATLTDVFPCFFLSCKANAKVYLAKTGHGPHSS